MVSFDFLLRLLADEVEADLISECFARLLCRFEARVSSSFPPPTLRSLVDALRFRAAGADLALAELEEVSAAGGFGSFGFVVGSVLDNDAGLADCLAEERVTLDDMRGSFTKVRV